jgi:hypothetical protein
VEGSVPYHSTGAEPVYRVQLLYTVIAERLPTPEAMVNVCTVSKLLRGKHDQDPIEAAAAAALFGLSQMSSFSYIGDDGYGFWREQEEIAIRLASSVGPSEWNEESVPVDGQSTTVFVYRTATMWALVMGGLELVAVGASGYGVEPSDYGFIQVEDVASYDVLFEE